jgi:hypothetical protein
MDERKSGGVDTRTKRYADVRGSLDVPAGGSVVEESRTRDEITGTTRDRVRPDVPKTMIV